MYCFSCGSLAAANSKFCEHCGARLESDDAQQVTVPETVQIKSKKVVIIASIVALIAVLLGTILFIAFGDSKKINGLLDMGDKYLEELDYDSAIATFNQILEIDPRNVDAYLGLIEVYIRENDFDKALEIAYEGYEKTDDERIKEKIDMIESGEIFDSLGRRKKTFFYDENRNIIAYHTYTYDKKGNEDVVAHYTADGVFVESMQLEYDDDNNRINAYGIGADGSISEFHYTYKDGKVVRSESEDTIITYEYEGELLVGESYEYPKIESMGTIYTEYVYDKKGTKIRSNRYDENHEILGYSTYDYEAGFLKKHYSYDKDGELLSRTEYIYKGNTIIGSDTYDGDGKLTFSSRSQ